jgi:hypothetical protein
MHKIPKILRIHIENKRCGKYQENGVRRYIDKRDGMLREPDGTKVPNNEDGYYRELSR